jgi:hypothetical protein
LVQNGKLFLKNDFVFGLNNFQTSSSLVPYPRIHLRLSICNTDMQMLCANPSCHYHSLGLDEVAVLDIDQCASCNMSFCAATSQQQCLQLLPRDFLATSSLKSCFDSSCRYCSRCIAKLAALRSQFPIGSSIDLSDARLSFVDALASGIVLATPDNDTEINVDGDEVDMESSPPQSPRRLRASPIVHQTANNDDTKPSEGTMNKHYFWEDLVVHLKVIG